jgi:hypothetical protein
MIGAMVVEHFAPTDLANEFRLTLRGWSQRTIHEITPKQSTK